MATMKTIAGLVAVVLTVTLGVPQMAVAEGQAPSSAIPTHEPQTWATPEQELPTEVEKKGSGWTWIILLAVIAGAAAAAGAGGGGEESSSSADGGTTGSYTGTW
jgi:hypothetical protein